MKKEREEYLAQAALEYDRDGAIVLRQVVPLDALKELGEAVDALMADGGHGMDSRQGGGRFFQDVYSTLHQPKFKEFVAKCGLAEIVGKIMHSEEVRFFYDQLLVKEPGTPSRTPWHQDLPYWPATGNQIISTWVPIDAASPESGVVTYVKGSHRWGKFFPTQPFVEDGPNEMAAELKKQLDSDNPIYDRGVGKRTLVDIREHPENYEFLTWEVEPGDVVVHHALAVHGAPGNATRTQRRRALALRWFGDDARWDDSRPHFLRMMKNNPNFPYPNLNQGDKMDTPLFPIAWTRSSDASQPC